MGEGGGGPVARSAGAGRARLAVPPGAADCHFHVYDSARAPAAAPWGAPGPGFDATAEDYRALAVRLGTTRGVLVQPSAYGTDNAPHLDALDALGGPGRFRLVAVVAADATDAELDALHARGCRGVRVNLARPGPLSAADLPALCARLAAREGWHVQVHPADEAAFVALGGALLAAPGTLVLDHMAHVARPGGAGFDLLRRLLDTGRGWVKLSAPYRASREGPPRYADAGAAAAALARHAPGRVVWGSDWPHPNLPPGAAAPDDAAILDLLADWVPGEEARRRVLVDNPAALYGFGPAVP